MIENILCIILSITGLILFGLFIGLMVYCESKDYKEES
jgi:hypothetical protein